MVDLKHPNVAQVDCTTSQITIGGVLKDVMRITCALSPLGIQSCLKRKALPSSLEIALRNHRSLRFVLDSTVNACARYSLTKAAAGEASGEESGRTQVQQALAEAEKAVEEATEAVPSVPSLPSAHPPHPWVNYMKIAGKTLFIVGALFGMLYLLDSGSLWLRCLVSLALPSVIALQSIRSQSLSPSGGLAALFVGFGTFLAGFRSVIILLSFFISSSALTKFKEETKQRDIADHKKGGQRDWIQVFSNGFFATLFCLTFAFSTGFKDLPLGSREMSKLSTFVFGAILGNYACTCGDTWASELGFLSTSPPRLITNLRPVQRGTNGGVTILGLMASLAGGLFVGLMCFGGSLIVALGQPPLPVMKTQWPVIVLASLGGLCGSLIDSILGATLQFSGYDRRLQKVVNRPGDEPGTVYKINGVDILSNNQVNLLSSLVMAILSGYATIRIYC